MIKELPVKKLSTGDAFDPKITWLVEGPWANHGVFAHHTDEANQQRVRFTSWTAQHAQPSTVKKEESLLLPDRQPLMANHLATMNGPFVVEIKQ